MTLLPPVLPPLSVGKMTLRLYGALNYSHGLSKGPSFGTGRGTPAVVSRVRRVEIDREYRKKKEGHTASDHAPVFADLD